MVGPRGGSPYVKRGGGRVFKQQYYQQAIAAQQAQAAAAAASYHHQQQQQQVVTAVAVAENAANDANKTSNNNNNELVQDGNGDTDSQKDIMSLRESAIVRYVKYHEWMELVIGTATETPTYVPPEVKIDGLEVGVKSAEDKSDTLAGLSEKGRFYKEASERLQTEFGLKSGATRTENKHDASETELKEKYGFEIVEQVKIKPVACNLGLPEPAKAPPREVVEAKIAKFVEAKAAAEAAAAAALTESSVLPVTDSLNEIPAAAAAIAGIQDVQMADMMPGTTTTTQQPPASSGLMLHAPLE